MMRIGLLQMRAVAGDINANLARIAAAALEAAGRGARLLIVPELSVTGYGAGDFIRVEAGPADGAQVRQLSAIAQESELALVAGFAERADGRVYNSAVLVGTEGSPAIYRKSHLYADYERALFSAGPPSACMATVGGLRVGMLICYDVEFPENVRRLALAGADLIAVPTALPAGPYARFIAERLISVRSFENQAFIAYANHVGSDDRFDYAGLSHIAAPDGSTLAIASSDSEELLVVDVRPEDYDDSRAANTYLQDLRLPDRE